MVQAGEAPDISAVPEITFPKRRRSERFSQEHLGATLQLIPVIRTSDKFSSYRDDLCRVVLMRIITLKREGLIPIPFLPFPCKKKSHFIFPSATSLGQRLRQKLLDGSFKSSVAATKTLGRQLGEQQAGFTDQIIIFEFTADIACSTLGHFKIFVVSNTPFCFNQLPFTKRMPQTRCRLVKSSHGPFVFMLALCNVESLCMEPRKMVLSDTRTRQLLISVFGVSIRVFHLLFFCYQINAWKLLLLYFFVLIVKALGMISFYSW